MDQSLNKPSTDRSLPASEPGVESLASSPITSSANPLNTAATKDRNALLKAAISKNQISPIDRPLNDAPKILASRIGVMLSVAGTALTAFSPVIAVNSFSIGDIKLGVASLFAGGALLLLTKQSWKWSRNLSSSLS